MFASAGTNVPLAVDYPTPVPPETGGPVGTRGNPYPIGETIAVGEWDITVTDVAEDATAEVLAENSFNEVPADGRQFFMVGIEATYNGDASDFLFASTSFSTVGPACRCVHRGGHVRRRARRDRGLLRGVPGRNGGRQLVLVGQEPKTSAASSSTPRKP